MRSHGQSALRTFLSWLFHGGDLPRSPLPNRALHAPPESGDVLVDKKGEPVQVIKREGQVVLIRRPGNKEPEICTLGQLTGSLGAQ